MRSDFIQKMRLDQALVKLGIVETRTKSSNLIKAGFVRVNDNPILKPAQIIDFNDNIVIDQKSLPWVSRGAEKLNFALEKFKVNPANKVIFDLGASTGGFTEVLLKYGAKKVYSIDVGRDQLHEKLRSDKRVCNMPSLDVREVVNLSLPNPEWIVADLAFISLVKALPLVMRQAISGAIMICLIKPQFELSKKEVGKNGIVKSDNLRSSAVSKVSKFVIRENWKILDTAPSPILGRQGNKEILLLAEKK